MAKIYPGWNIRGAPVPPHFISTNLGPWPWFATKWTTTIKNTQLQNENPGSRGINIGLLQNVMPKGFISNFNIQHVTSCFVAGLFVAITSFCRSIGGISFWLPTKKLQNVFRVKQQVATKWFVVLCYHMLSKQEQLQNGFTASPYKPTHILKKHPLLQNGGLGCIFKTLFH